MKTIVLSNLKQVFQTIMTLCNILQLRATAYTDKMAMYIDVFDENKVIFLNKKYSEVFYHDYTNDIHVQYEINNSDKLFVEYYNRYENSNDIISKLNEVIENLKKENTDLNEEIETVSNESIREIDYLNGRIDTLKKEYNAIISENYDLLISDNFDLTDKIQSLEYDNKLYSNQLEIVNSKLAYYENEYKDVVAEKIKQQEDKYNHLLEVAKKERQQMKNDIASYQYQIESLERQNNYLHKKIRKMINK